MDNKKTKYRRFPHLLETGTGKMSWHILFVIVSLFREILGGDRSSGVEPFVRNIVIFDDEAPNTTAVLNGFRKWLKLGG